MSYGACFLHLVDVLGDVTRYRVMRIADSIWQVILFDFHSFLSRGIISSREYLVG